MSISFIFSILTLLSIITVFIITGQHIAHVPIVTQIESLLITLTVAVAETIAELQEILEGITIPPHISTLTLEMAYEGLQSLLQGNLLDAAAGLLNGRHSGVIALISSAVSDSGLKATFMLDGYPAADGNKAKGRLAIVFEGSGTGGSFVSEGYTMDAEELQIGNHTLTLSGISGNLIAPDGSRASLTICPDGAELSRGAVFGTPESGRLGCGSWEMEL